ncbi:hypothetical protein [Agromyces mariniharenae]|uniref:Uncharacterized protein n=1 Tax=Agromyces mariniharenae TaxID=2604423 RepID=A0A5S4UWV1_9MICO|nr:hypothetical protein [Agromyces mariniharenae]TYL51042.1 hypothetical protein FYC51_18090 [Agromyces mariniharenae]
MGYSIERLRGMTDDELVAEHDHVAKSTQVGVNYYLDELDRRSRDRATVAANRLARNSFWLSVVGTVLSVISTAIAVLALFVAIENG